MEEKLSLNKIVGMNLKRIIRQSRYRTQGLFGPPLHGFNGRRIFRKETGIVGR